MVLFDQLSQNPGRVREILEQKRIEQERRQANSFLKNCLPFHGLKEPNAQPSSRSKKQKLGSRTEEMKHKMKERKHKKR